MEYYNLALDSTNTKMKKKTLFVDWMNANTTITVIYLHSDGAIVRGIDVWMNSERKMRWNKLKL